MWLDDEWYNPMLWWWGFVPGKLMLNDSNQRWLAQFSSGEVWIKDFEMQKDQVCSKHYDTWITVLEGYCQPNMNSSDVITESICSLWNRKNCVEILLCAISCKKNLVLSYRLFTNLQEYQECMILILMHRFIRFV